MRYLMIFAATCMWIHTSYGEPYRRATEDPDNVKAKIFTKRGRLEINAPDIGFIMNQPLITTYLIHGGVTYYKSEEWGYGFEASYGINQDTEERECLETFYNDSNNSVADECGDGSGLDNTTSNYGPAYMPIREINYILAGNLVWNPVYGKQLFLMSGTSYFDVMITMGGGVVMSDYYEQRTVLANGNSSRGDPDNTGTLTGGASTNETDSYGEAGRPEPESQIHPFINLGVGQKFHFWENYSFKVEFRNMTLLGTPEGFENLFALWSGFGYRF